MKKIETDDDFSDIERALEALCPRALPEAFFAAVEAQLDASAEVGADAPRAVGNAPVQRGNAVDFRSRSRASAICFPFRRVAASAALVLCAIGAGVWSYSQFDGNDDSASASRYFAGAHSGSAVNAQAVADGAAFAVGSVPSASGVETFSAASQAKRRSRGDFRLVKVERRMNSAKPETIVSNADGSFSKNVRYSYTDEYRWEDNSSGAAFVELRPHEEIISMEMPIY